MRAVLVLVVRAGPEGQAGDGGRQLGRVHGLGDMRLESGEQGPFAVLRAGEGGQGDGGDLSRRVDGPHPANEIIPVRVGHANIADDHVGAEPLDYEETNEFSAEDMKHARGKAYAYNLKIEDDRSQVKAGPALKILVDEV
jgi:hypothetical protein